MYQFIICFIAGIGAGLGTGFAGMSAAQFANKADPVVLNRATGAVLVVLGGAILLVNWLG